MKDSMTYPEINGTLAGSNLGYLLVYANQVTLGFFGLFITFGFFLVVLLGSLFAQFRYSGRIRFETSLLASSFATFGWAVILEQYSGILSPIYFFIIVGILILSIIWVALSSD